MFTNLKYRSDEQETDKIIGNLEIHVFEIQKS